MNISSFLTDYNKNLPIDILYDDLIGIGMTYYKLNIYNKNINHPMQKFWFLIPKAKVSEINDNSIKITLSYSENDNNFIKIIKNIEDNVKNHINDIMSINIIRSALKNRSKFYPELSVKLNKKTKIFDSKGNIIPLSINSIVSLYIELSEVLINENDFYSTTIFNTLQVKVLDNLDFSQTLFDYDVSKPFILPVLPQPTIINTETPREIPRIHSSITITPKVSNTISQKPSTLTGLTPALLMAQMQRLKKTIKDEETPKEEPKTNIIDMTITKLNKVITREPLTVHELYKLEQENNKINTFDLLQAYDNIMKSEKEFRKRNKINNKKYKKISKSFNRLLRDI